MICTPNALAFPIAEGCSAGGQKQRNLLKSRSPPSIAPGPRTGSTSPGKKKLRNCTSHNLRFYPMVQHMRRMVEAGDLGDIMVTSRHLLPGLATLRYRLETGAWDRKFNGPLRAALADIGSHWVRHAETHHRPAHHQRLPATWPPSTRPANSQGPHRDFSPANALARGLHRNSDRYRGHGAVVFRMGNGARRRLHRQPGERRLQATACQIEILRHQVRPLAGVRSSQTSSGSAIATSTTRSSSRTRRCFKAGRQTPTPICRAVTAKATTTAFKQIFPPFSTSRSRTPPPRPKYPQFMDGLASADHSRSRDGKQREATAGWTSRRFPG